jgi:UDP:flavonoid glycosyltransferase YjiC (YdhE family)
MSALPSLGHVNPCLSVGLALRDAGHEVRVATAPGLAPHVRRAGFTQVNLGFDLPRPGDRLSSGLVQRLYKWLLDSFDFWVDDMRGHIADWSPDLLIHDWSEVAGVAAGAQLGIPSAVLGNALRPPMTNVTESRCWLGVDIDQLGGPDNAFGDLLLNFYPPSFAVPGEPRLAHEHFVQPPSYDGASHSEPPPWLDSLGSPLVYLTIGTYYARLPGVLERLVAAAAGVSAQFVVTVGNARDAEEFAPLPTNVRVVQYVPQSLIIPSCAVVVCQGALTSMIAALSHGIPVACLPITWGQPLGHNAAERCTALGAGLLHPLTGSPDTLDPDHIVRMIDTLLDESAYREQARRLQAEISTLPAIADTIPLMEKLVS